MIDCRLCHRSFYRISESHLQSVHKISSGEYSRRFPGAPFMGEGAKQHISRTSIGRTWTWDKDAPGRKSLSELRDGVSLSPEHCEAISRGHTGLVRAPFTAEHCRNLSLARLENWRDPKYAEEVVTNMRKGLKRLYVGMTKEEREAWLSHPGPMSEEGRKAIAEANKRKWQDPDYVKMMVEAFHRRPTNDELQLKVVLSRYFNGFWVYNGDGGRQGLLIELGYRGTRQPDFFRTDGVKQVIEVFSWWHDTELFPKRLTEEEMVAEYLGYGWECLILWDDEVWNEALVIEKTKELVNS